MEKCSNDAQGPQLLQFETPPPGLQSTCTKWWIIPVPQDKDVIWNIVLAYLNHPFPKSSAGSPISRLLDRRTVSKAARYCVQEYNPFISGRRRVCNESMAEVVDQFGKRIEEYIKRHLNVFQSTMGSHNILKAASLLLSCKITLLYKANTLENKIYSSETFIPEEIPLKALKTTLIIHKTLAESDDAFLYESYSFFLPEGIGRNKQKLALSEILKKTKVESQAVNCICELENIGQDFISSLLVSDLADNIPLIYKSPYILSKLQDAKFVIDPREISSSTGQSALHHALQLQRTDLLYFLYNQAVSNCYSAQGSVRSPDSTILNNLLCMGNELAGMRDKGVVEKDSYLKKLDELCLFNEFQTEICKKMFSVLQRISYYIKTDKIVEAEKAKDVILSIMQTYIRYFNWSDEDNATRIERLASFQTFCLHKDYFDSVDFCSAVMFFDNIHLLKERLELQDKYCSKMETQFFNFVYCRKYFDVDVPNATRKSIILSKVIMFQERKVLERNLKEFQEVLSGIIVSKENIRERIPEEEVLELTDQVHIYGQVLLFRLRHYLDTAVSVSLKSPTAIYVILRALQVFGECVKDSDFKSIQKVLTLSLPASLVTELKRIRNNLSHLKPHELIYRERIEENVMLFKKIQQELKTLKKFLSPIFSSHEQTMEFFDLNRSLKAVSRLMKGNIPKKEWKSLKEILPPPKDGESIKESKRKITFGFFSQIRNSLVNKIKRSWNCRAIRKNALCYKYLIENLILNTNIKLSLVKLNKGNMTQLKESIESIQNFFWSTEYLLGYLVKDKHLLKYRRKVLNLIKHRLNHFEMMENLENLRKIMTTDEFVNFLKESENFVANYTIITNEIFDSLSVSDGRRPNFPSIEKMCVMLKGKIFLNNDEKWQLRESVPSGFKDIHVAKETVIRIITGHLPLSVYNLSVWIDCLGLNSSQKQDILQSLSIGETANALKVVSKIKDIYGELKEVLKNNTIRKKRFDYLTEKIDFPENLKSLLEKLVEGRNIRVNGNKINFLIDRVKNLEQCLIHSNKEIETIWEEAKSERKKDYLREKMAELYLNEPAVQAAIEMLLFDCMNILQTKELEYLWKKSERLFKGLYLRNLLAHGKPILEVTGKFLDPEDLPLEMVSKVLQLMSDKNALNCILELYESCNQDFTEMSRILKDEKDIKFSELREEIRKCDRWESYVKLLPRNSEKLARA